MWPNIMIECYEIKTYMSGDFLGYNGFTLACKNNNLELIKLLI